jgi:hypothetical protein
VLRLAGARAVVVVAVGRVLRPDRVPAHRAFLQRCAGRGNELAEEHEGGGAQGPDSCDAIDAPSWSASATATTHCS